MVIFSDFAKQPVLLGLVSYNEPRMTKYSPVVQDCLDATSRSSCTEEDCQAMFGPTLTHLDDMQRAFWISTCITFIWLDYGHQLYRCIFCHLFFEVFERLTKVAFFVSLPFFQGARARGSPSLLAQRPRRWAYPDNARGAECQGQLGHWRGTSRRSADQQQSPWLLSGVTWDKGNREKHFQEHTIHRKTLRFRCFFVFPEWQRSIQCRAFWRTLLRRRIRNETIRDLCLLHIGARAFSSGENPEALYMQVFCTARDKSRWITLFGSSNKLSVRAYFAHFCSVLSDCKPTAKQSASIDDTSLRKMSAARS